MATVSDCGTIGNPTKHQMYSTGKEYANELLVQSGLHNEFVHSPEIAEDEQVTKHARKTPPEVLIVRLKMGLPKDVDMLSSLDPPPAALEKKYSPSDILVIFRMARLEQEKMERLRKSCGRHERCMPEMCMPSLRRVTSSNVRYIFRTEED